MKNEAKEFIEFVRTERDLFVNKVVSQEWNTEMRCASESLLIAYDQMVDRLKACERQKQPDTESKLNIADVSVTKHTLPRPLECWNKARELDCGDYIEWHLEKERGNAR